MDVEMLRQYKEGDQVDCGLLLPAVDDNSEVRWTVTGVVDGTRDIEGASPKFRIVYFGLDFMGVEMGALVATENAHNKVEWRVAQ